MTDLTPARYAPGDYLCACSECGRQFAGDKRATRCKSCATLVTRIAELEAERHRLRGVMREAAHMAATLGSGSEGWLRGRFMSISNILNATLQLGQSSHGNQYDDAGNVTKSNQHE